MERPQWHGSRPAGRSRPVIDSDVFPPLGAPLAPAEKEKDGGRKEIRKLPALY